MSTTSIKPLELVVSAIHCLKEKKGSSPQNILKYLSGKYDGDTETLKGQVQTGLRRGVSFGLITNNSGLYRLNEILSAQSEVPVEKAKSNGFFKTTRSVPRRKPLKSVGRKGRQRHLKTCPSSKRYAKRKPKGRKPGGSSRRLQNLSPKARKSKQNKPKGKRVQKGKNKKSKKSNFRTSCLNLDSAEQQNPINVQEPDVMENTVKT